MLQDFEGHSSSSNEEEEEEEEAVLELTKSAELITDYVNDLQSFFDIIDNLTHALHEEADELEEIRDVGKDGNGQ